MQCPIKSRTRRLLKLVCVCVFQAASEVENLKTQLMSLFKELQQAQSKLDDAENMKKNLQDRSFTLIITHSSICMYG